MNLEKLLQKIGLGEDSSLELKEVKFVGNRVAAPSRDTLADELAAMGNGRGGTCVLGVSDKPRKVVGIPLPMLDSVEALVREVCNDSIDPPLFAHIERMLLPSGEGQNVPVLVVDVERSLYVHCSPGGYFHRVGSSKRKLAPDYLARLFQQRSQVRVIHFDEQIVPGIDIGGLSPALWERFRTPRTKDGRDDLLMKLGMAAADVDGVIRPTVSAVLMATQDPTQWMRNAFVQAVAYRGTSVVPESKSVPYQLDAKDITGPLDQQVLDACQFIYKNMRIYAKKEFGREDIPQFDMLAVFEAMVNAVVHRDYSIYGSKVRLRLFSDRLELYSPGGIPNTMTVDSLSYRQSARNDALASLLAQCRIPDIAWLRTSRIMFMDRRGEGVRMILDESEALSGRRPEYRLLGEDELMLTIWAADPFKETASTTDNGEHL